MNEETAFRTTEGGRHCPVCRHVATPAATFPEYQLFSCKHCGCWSSDALYRGADISFENRNYFDNPELDEGKWGALIRELTNQGLEARSVLDVGCGTGAYLAFVARERPDLHCEGIEIDPARAAQARSNNPNARIHEGDASEVMAGVSGPFDLITLWDVFEHVPNPVQLLCELSKRLSPGGFIHIVTIHERSVVPMLGRLGYRITGGRLSYPIRRTHEAHHLCFFTREGLDIAVETAGLEIHRVSYDRLARGRMDGSKLVTAATSALLTIENALGNGLFIELTLRAPSRSEGTS